MPHLRKLVLRVECYDKDVAELLKYLTLGDTSMMLPSLNIFELKVQELFTGKTHLEELDEVLVRIIDARWNVPKELSVAQLRQVRIRCSKAGIEGTVVDVEKQEDQATRNLRTLSRVDRLKSFKTEGLDISIIFEQENGYGWMEDRVFL